MWLPAINRMPRLPAGECLDGMTVKPRQIRLMRNPVDRSRGQRTARSRDERSTWPALSFDTTRPTRQLLNSADAEQVRSHSKSNSRACFVLGLLRTAHLLLFFRNVL